MLILSDFILETDPRLKNWIIVFYVAWHSVQNINSQKPLVQENCVYWIFTPYETSHSHKSQYINPKKSKKRRIVKKKPSLWNKL